MLQECPATSKLIQASSANASAPQSSGHLSWRRHCHAKPARKEHLSVPRCLWPIHIAASTASWISGAADQPISLSSTTASIRGVLFHHYISRLPPKVPTQKKENGCDHSCAAATKDEQYARPEAVAQLHPEAEHECTDQNLCPRGCVRTRDLPGVSV